MTWDIPALLPIREEGVLRILIALKNPSPWLGSNPRPLGPVLSILTTTSPRQLWNHDEVLVLIFLVLLFVRYFHFMWDV
jgi:hypothetical protein